MGAVQSSSAVTRQNADCPTCGRDLGGLGQAVYCPGCGQKIFSRTKWGRLIGFGMAIFHSLSFGRFRNPQQMPIDRTGRTPILIGYGNAMFNLGWRYERGCGTHRNLPEAVRCYKKSARLGNVDATIRLAVEQSYTTPQRVIPIR